MNGLKGGVTIKTFDLPSNDPAGGIHLTLEAVTTNVWFFSSFSNLRLMIVNSRRKSALISLPLDSTTSPPALRLDRLSVLDLLTWLP
jgi:hypothetical protein